MKQLNCSYKILSNTEEFRIFSDRIRRKIIQIKFGLQHPGEPSHTNHLRKDLI